MLEWPFMILGAVQLALVNLDDLPLDSKFHATFCLHPLQRLVDRCLETELVVGPCLRCQRGLSVQDADFAVRDEGRGCCKEVPDVVDVPQMGTVKKTSVLLAIWVGTLHGEVQPRPVRSDNKRLVTELAGWESWEEAKFHQLVPNLLVGPIAWVSNSLAQSLSPWS